MNSSPFVTTEQYDLSALDAVFNTSVTDTIEQPSKALINSSLERVLDAADVVTKPKEEEPTTVITDKGVLDVLDNVEKELVPPVTPETADVTVELQGGRPKVEKDAMIEYLAAKIEAQDFGVPEDYDAKIPVKDYLGTKSVKDIYSILDSNWTAKEQELRNQAPVEFYQALPNEAKRVAEYAAEPGAKNWPAFFSSLARTEQVRQFDINKEEDHIPIVGTYLAETTQLTPDQISEQIEEWKESGKLDKKAAEFKSPLDAIQKQRTDTLIQQAQAESQKQAEIANFYAENVYKVTNTNELAGYKLDKKFSKELAYNMTTVAPGPWTGQPVNYLGYGLEKCQYVEPDYEAVLLAAWILNDKAGALSALSQKGSNEAATQAVKLIKLNQGIPASTQQPQETAKPVKRLPNNSNVLRRTG